ncbi:MAG TPA: hypothetical protein VGK67_41005 [Myxococcales bacterium]|jgi:hypothetical protein
MDSPSNEPAFALARGGPFFSLLKASRLLRGDGRSTARAALAGIALTWLPLMLLAPLAGGAGSVLADYAVHAKLLVALPILLKAEVLVHDLAGGTLARFLRARRDEGLAPGAFEGQLQRAARLWNSAAAELVCLLTALVFGQLRLWEAGADLLQVHLQAHAQRSISASALWYCFVAAPIVNFLFFRSLWRWGVWVLILWRFSRLELRLIPTNPDQCCGLSNLAIPSTGFALVFMTFSVTVAGAWATQIVHHGAALTSFERPLALLVAVALVLGLGPLFVFSGKLYRAKLRGQVQYQALARAYTMLFHERWIERRDTEGLLGTSDIQSLADLANSYALVRQTRLVPFDRRDVLIVAGAVLAPMVPLVLTQVSLRELASKLASALL